MTLQRMMTKDKPKELHASKATAIRRVFDRMKQKLESDLRRPPANFAYAVMASYPEDTGNALESLEREHRGATNAWINYAFLNPLMDAISELCTNGSHVKIIERTQKRLHEIVFSNEIREELGESRRPVEDMPDVRGRIIVVKDTEELLKVVNLIKELAPEKAEPCKITSRILSEEKTVEETVLIIGLKIKEANAIHPVREMEYTREGQCFATLEIRIRTEEQHKQAQQNAPESLWKGQFS